MFGEENVLIKIGIYSNIMWGKSTKYMKTFSLCEEKILNILELFPRRKMLNRKINMPPSKLSISGHYIPLATHVTLHWLAGGKCYASPTTLMKFTVQWSATVWLVECYTFHWPAGGA